MDEPIKLPVKDKSPTQNHFYTVYDRELIKASRGHVEVMVKFLVPVTEGYDENDEVPCGVVSVDRYSVKFAFEDGRQKWISKQFIVSTEIPAQ
jgi:hypothetical protein